MANVLNKFTKQYLESINTPDYSPSDWIINPKLPDCDPKYWIIEDDNVREMTQLEKEEYTYTHESTVYLIAEKLLLTNQNGSNYEGDSNAIINPVMPNCDLKYTKVVSGEVVEMSSEEQDAIDLAEAIQAKQNAIKQECTAHILEAYPEPIQRSAALGVYPSEVVDAMTSFIAACIAEENRCYDELESATSMKEVEIIEPSFPEA